VVLWLTPTVKCSPSQASGERCSEITILVLHLLGEGLRPSPSWRRSGDLAEHKF
jgi:hypothetical protein